MCMYDYNMMISIFGQVPNKRFELELEVYPLYLRLVHKDLVVFKLTIIS